MIECPYCRARVDAREVATYESHAPEEHFDPAVDPWPYRATLLFCISCKNVLLAREEDEGYPDNEEEWSDPIRLYPPVDAQELSTDIPEAIRASLAEARRCLGAEAYSSSAVMCGRALEGICRHFKAGNSIGAGLRELQRQGLLDPTLMKWCELIQKHRNISAHATGELTSHQDAVDLIEFTSAICEYLFVLGERFRRFKARMTPGTTSSPTVQ